MAVAEGIAIGTAIAPGIGTTVGGVIGAGIDIFNFLSGQSAKDKQATLDYKKALAEGKAQLTELTTKAGAYQDFLNKLPVAGSALNGTTGDLAFDQQYRALVENTASTNVLAGLRGTVGAPPGVGPTSAQAVGKATEDLTSSFVQAEKDRADQQLAIYRAGIESTKAGIAAQKQARDESTGGLFGHGGFLGLGIG
jgi:hypothetical protein